MEYNSFYGGRRGASFIIVKSYATEQEMIAEFAKGGQYKAVNYDEYVIIDTVNKNDITNGKIYRRGYDYTNEWGGAEYVGQIVGPAGLGPHAEVIEKSEVNQKWKDAEGSLDHLDYRYGTGTLDTETNDLVPGAKGEVNNRTFDDETDKIHWEYFSLRDEHQLESTCYIGYQVPYTVFDFFTHHVEPYDADGNYADMTAALRQSISDEHPFYEQWEIKIPKGVKGDMLDNFRLYTPTTDETLPDFGGVNHMLGAGRTVLIYDYWTYDNKQEGEKVTLYLGEYEVIDDILIADDGTVTVKYKSNRDDTIFNKRIQWIDSVELTQSGDLTVNYNNGAAPYKTHLVWVRNMSLAADGTITVIYNDDTTSELPQQLRWMTGIRMAHDGTITTEWNNNPETDEFDERITWIDDITLQDNGQLFVQYNNITEPQLINTVRWIKSSQYWIDPEAKKGYIRFTYNTSEEDTEDFEFKYIGEVNLTETGTFTVDANTGENLLTTEIIFPKTVVLEGGHRLIITANDGETILLDEELVWVENIEIVDDRFKLFYNNGETKVLEDILLNQVEEITIPTDATNPYAYHLLVYYTALEKRGIIDYKGKTGWVDLGVVKDYNGILIGHNIDSTTMPELDDPMNAVEYLNTTYPQGIVEGYSSGKVITIGPDVDEKRLYAYDYSNHEWFYLGNPSGVKDVRSVIVGEANDADTLAAAQLMPTGSLWFVLEGAE